MEEEKKDKEKWRYAGNRRCIQVYRKKRSYCIVL